MGELLNKDKQLKDPNNHRNEAYRKLIDTNIISCVWKHLDSIGRKNKIDKLYIRWMHPGLCLYPSSEGVVLSNTSRDHILSNLLNEGLIELDGSKQFETTEPMFFGWGIKFKYRKYSFHWQTNNWVDMYEGDKKLFDTEKGKTLHTEFNGQGEYSFHDTKSLEDELRRCVETYEKLKNNSSLKIRYRLSGFSHIAKEFFEKFSI